MFSIPIILSILFYTTVILLNILALIVVPRNRKPSSGTAWLLVIFLLPFLGWLIFLVIGRNKLPEPRKNAQRNADKSLNRSLEKLSQQASVKNIINAEVPKKYQAVASLANALGHMPVFSHNKISQFDDYQAPIDSIVKDIASATDSVYVGYYIFNYDETTKPIVDALVAAKNRGVAVRVLYDAFGSRKFPGVKKMKHIFTSNNIPCKPMLPLTWPGKNYLRPDLRNHRKIVSIDQKIGYTGSQNLVQRDYHRKDEIVYDEMVVRITGPIVYQLTAIFASDWHAETGEVLKGLVPSFKNGLSKQQPGSLLQFVPSGPGYEDENNLKVFTQLFYAAESSIKIVNPYFVPPEPLFNAILAAVSRGVKVTMINSEASDQWMVAHAQRSYYEKLLKAGVEINLYKKPTLLHSKYLIVDDEVVVIGSSNLDVRSFELNHELSLVCYDRGFAKKMAKQTDIYLGRSKKLTINEWQKRKLPAQILDNIARLTSALQ